MMKKVGIIVGKGQLPIFFIKEAAALGYEVYPLGLFDDIENEIKEHKNYLRASVGEGEKIVKFFLGNDVKEVVLLGKVEKALAFKELQLDRYTREIMDKLPDKKDETMILSVIAFMRLCGVKIMPQNKLLKRLMFAKKCYTMKRPSEEDKKTIALGVEAAKKLSSLDIGQTVVCKDSAVVAIEGIEGTDETIKRAGSYAGRETIIIKMSRPHQDMRIDVPTVGIETVKQAMSIGAKGIVGESKKMLFANQKEATRLANEAGIFIVGIKP